MENCECFNKCQQTCKKDRVDNQINVWVWDSYGSGRRCCSKEELIQYLAKGYSLENKKYVPWEY